MEPHVQIILNSAWFKEFPPGAVNELAAAGRIRHYKDQEVLHRVGEPAPGLDIILQGGVRNSSMSPDGHEFSFSLLKPGAFVGLVSCLDDMGAVNTATAHGPTQVFAIPRAAVVCILERHPELYSRFVQMLCYRMRKAMSVIDELALVPIRQRLARQLCTLVFAEYGQTVGAGEIGLDMTQNDLAVLLGVTRAMVNRALKELEDEGLLRARYRKIMVTDFAALHACCAEQRLFAL